ncbi:MULTISPECIES: hypothetical protein [unclassified Paenibacillus]|uniref:hypothetical protein n=1 Tax=unclassified Paenibacillus TaxID=185978 RepID=UPI00383561CE
MKFYNEPYTINELLELIYSNVCIMKYFVIRIPCDQVHLDAYSISKMEKHLKGTCEEWEVKDNWYSITFSIGEHPYVTRFDEHRYLTTHFVRDICEWLHVDPDSIELECHLGELDCSRADMGIE